MCVVVVVVVVDVATAATDVAVVYQAPALFSFYSGFPLLPRTCPYIYNAQYPMCTCRMHFVVGFFYLSVSFFFAYSYFLFSFLAYPFSRLCPCCGRCEKPSHEPLSLSDMVGRPHVPCAHSIEDFECTGTTSLQYRSAGCIAPMYEFLSLWRRGWNTPPSPATLQSSLCCPTSPANSLATLAQPSSF